MQLESNILLTAQGHLRMRYMYKYTYSYTSYTFPKYGKLLHELRHPVSILFHQHTSVQY